MKRIFKINNWKVDKLDNELFKILKKVDKIRIENPNEYYVKDWDWKDTIISPYGYYPSSIALKKMIIMENPGKGEIYSYELKLETDKYFKWFDNQNLETASALVKANQYSLCSWLATGNPYLRNIFHKLYELGMISEKFKISSIEEYVDYVKNGLLNDFIITDAYKFRDIKDPDKKNHIEILREEIELCKPKIIITFGRKSWEYLLSICGKKNLKMIYPTKNDSINKSITKMQGKLVQYPKLNTLILPLSHFSATNSKRKIIMKRLNDIVKDESIKKIVKKHLEE